MEKVEVYLQQKRRRKVTTGFYKIKGSTDERTGGHTDILLYRKAILLIVPGWNSLDKNVMIL